MHHRAKAYVVDYIDRFHHPVHHHSTLGYLGPLDFERQAQVVDLASKTGSRSAQRSRREALDLP